MKCMVMERCKMAGQLSYITVAVKNSSYSPKFSFLVISGPAGRKWIHSVPFPARPGGNGFIDCISGPAGPKMVEFFLLSETTSFCL